MVALAVKQGVEKYNTRQMSWSKKEKVQLHTQWGSKAACVQWELLTERRQ